MTISPTPTSATPTSATPTSATPTSPTATSATAAPSAATSVGIASPSEARPLPRFGGFSPTLLRLELTRKLRNPRTLIFALMMPGVFYCIFGLTQRGTMLGDADAAMYIAVSLAAYGAMVATTTGGAQVAVERALGWSRQLALTPLRPIAYIGVKIVVSMLLGAVSVAIVFLLTVVTGSNASLETLLLCGLLVVATSAVFAAFGVMLGYLLPSENAIQVSSLALTVFALIGGLFVPLSTWPHALQTIARFTPAYGVGEISRIPLGGGYDQWALVNVVVWLVIFSAGAIWAMRRDTARV